MRQTRAIQRDRQTQPTLAPSAAPVEAWLHEVIHPATLAQVAAYQQLGLRARVLTLPVLVAFVVSLIGRQLGSVSEAVRVLRAAGLLWAGPTAVSQQALSLRLRCFPPALFERVLLEVLPQAQARWQARQRPLPPLLARLQRRFTAVLALDGATLDAVLHKAGLLRGQPGGALGGRIAAVLDVASMLPRQVWYEADQRANDQRCWDRALTQLPAGALVLFDGGFLNYAHYDDLGARGVTFLTRAGAKMADRVTAVLQQTPTLRDRLVAVGSHPQHRCTRPLRLVEVQCGRTWHRYLTNAVDPAQLAALDVRAVYALRWSIERAFLLAKRLLGLAYLWTGAVNGVLTQVWATWLLYTALTDLSDAVAETLRLPAERISVELTYRALYHFTQAFHRGAATDVVAYLALHATALGLFKRRRSPPQTPLTPPLDPELVTVVVKHGLEQDYRLPDRGSNSFDSQTLGSSNRYTMTATRICSQPITCRFPVHVKTCRQWIGIRPRDHAAHFTAPFLAKVPLEGEQLGIQNAQALAKAIPSHGSIHARAPALLARTIEHLSIDHKPHASGQRSLHRAKNLPNDAHLSPRRRVSEARASC